MFSRMRRSGAARREATGRFGRLVRQTSGLDPFQDDDRPDSAFEQIWRVVVKRRTFVLLAGIACWVAGLEARLIQLQVFRHDAYTAIAEQQQQARITIEAMRGDIVDRNGNLLAYSVHGDGIVADPTRVEDAAATVAAVCGALGDCTAKERKELVTRLAGDKRFAVVRRARNVTVEQLDRVMALGLPGIDRRTEVLRYHPALETAAHTVGFTGTENEGRAGIEYTRNAELQGRDGEGIAQVTGGLSRQRLDTRVVTRPEPGASIELTIDLPLQRIVERELQAGVAENRAVGGTAIVMDPWTGDILALANVPTFNPNAFGDFGAASVNRAVQSVYEPGSTFKIVTASAALEEGLVRPEDPIDTSPGYIAVPGRTRLVHDTHNYGVISFEDVIVKSSNVGAIKTGARLGVERLTDYVQRFGFGQRIAPDFPGESRGIWNPSNLTQSGLASISMGYQVSVTPIQMAAAASVVANGGLLMEPHVVRATLRDGERIEVQPKALRRVIRPETAATMTRIMEGVVERGTATRAQIAGFYVAGKTGTSNKAVPGGYSPTDFNASFVGFVPARHPRFTILVVIDTPRAGSHFGGGVAAPIFQRIAEAALIDAGVAPTIDPIPPVFVSPRGPTLPVQRVSASAVVPTVMRTGGAPIVPDVRGLSGREALRVLSAAGLSVRMRGTGFVVRQVPAAGAPLESNRRGTIELSRDPSALTRDRQ